LFLPSAPGADGGRHSASTQEAQEINNDYILNPELSWVKVPERLTFTTAFLKIPSDVRAMAIAVYVTGIGHAASENDPIIDATLLPTMLGAPEGPVRLAVGQLITVGLWQPVDDDRVDTGMGGQLQARAEAREAKSKTGRASAESRRRKNETDALAAAAAATESPDVDRPFE